MPVIIAKVTVDQGDSSGGPSNSRSQSSVAVDMVVGDDGIPCLSIAMKPKELLVPLHPPAALYTTRLSAGQLGMRFQKFRPNPWERAERTLTLTITAAGLEDVPALTSLARGVDKALSKLRRGVPGRAGPPPIVHRRVLTNLNTASSAPSGGGAFSIAGKPQTPASACEEELPPLSAEQQRALDLVKAGRNVFFTGCAGTGKSLVLRHIMRVLPADSTYVTGTTGMAGSLLGGTTINAFAGVGHGDGDANDLAARAGRGASGARWRKATALIIDEVSMMEGRMFDLLEYTARKVRGSNRPFGGLQLILSGDFHQLPPVAKNAASRKFAFESEAWERCVHASIQLTQVFRQTDHTFIDILAEVRSGTAPEATLRTLLARCARPLDVEDGIQPTRLFTHRADVDRINEQELAALPGETCVFRAVDAGEASTLDAACSTPRTVKLKVGAQVMLTKNLSAKRGLVNGARGVVEGFTRAGMPIVKWVQGGEAMPISQEKTSINQGGQETAWRRQIPLALAWAVTVHKSQGLSLDRVEVSLDRAFEAGMAYVALSRARCLEGLRIVGGVASAALRADSKVVAFYRRISLTR